MEEKNILKLVSDSMYAYYYMLEKYKKGVYIQTVLNDISYNLKKKKDDKK